MPYLINNKFWQGRPYPKYFEGETNVGFDIIASRTHPLTAHQSMAPVLANEFTGCESSPTR